MFASLHPAELRAAETVPDAKRLPVGYRRWSELGRGVRRWVMSLDFLPPSVEV